MGPCIGIILAFVVMPVSAYHGTAELIARLAYKPYTACYVTHRERDIICRTRYRYPVRYRKVRIETILGSGIQPAGQVAASPGAETYGLSVLPGE